MANIILKNNLSGTMTPKQTMTGSLSMGGSRIVSPEWDDILNKPDFSTVEVSETEPINEEVVLWLNPDGEEILDIPEINDEVISTVDTWSSSKINKEIANSSNNVGIIDKLPIPSEMYRGYFRIVPNGNNDELYICLKINGEYKWILFTISSIDNDTTSELGVAILDTLILA